MTPKHARHKHIHDERHPAAIALPHTYVSNTILSQSQFPVYTLKMRQVNINFFTLLLLYYAAVSSSALADDSCPQQFFDLKLPNTSKQCRVFGVKKPSTLSFYLHENPETAFEAFKSQLAGARQSQTSSMLSLVSEQPKVRIYVYADGAGTQVNIRAE